MIIEQRLTTTQWMEIPKDIREKLVVLFGIPRSSYMDVRGMQVFSDGYTNEDLKAITIEKLKANTGLEVGDLFAQLTEVIIKLQKPLEVQTNTNETSKQNETTISTGAINETGTRQKRGNNKGKSISIPSTK